MLKDGSVAVSVDVDATGVVVVVLAVAVMVEVCVAADAVVVTEVVHLMICVERQEHTCAATTEPRLDICA